MSSAGGVGSPARRGARGRGERGGAAPRPREIWIVDAEQWARACLRAELLERGHEAIGFPSFVQALRALAVRSPPALLIVDLRGQQLSAPGLALLARLRVPVAAIAGVVEAAAPLVRAFSWRAIWRRPVRLGVIADGVERLMAVVESAAPSRMA